MDDFGHNSFRLVSIDLSRNIHLNIYNKLFIRGLNSRMLKLCVKVLRPLAFDSMGKLSFNC